MVAHPEVGPWPRGLLPELSPSVYRSIRSGVTQAHREMNLSAAPKPEAARANSYRYCPISLLQRRFKRRGCASSFRVADDPLATPVFGVPTSHSLATHSGRIVFATPQIATTATARPEALTSRSMSPGSPVRMVAFCRMAVD